MLLIILKTMCTKRYQRLELASLLLFAFVIYFKSRDCDECVPETKKRAPVAYEKSDPTCWVFLFPEPLDSTVFFKENSDFFFDALQGRNREIDKNINLID